MDLSKILAVLAFVLQIGNLVLALVQVYAPEYALFASGILAAVQAFTKAVTAPSVK